MARDTEDERARRGRAARLLALREREGLTQAQAAAAIGVTRAGYQNWERGRDRISPTRFHAIARVFNTTEQWIEHGTGPDRLPDGEAEQATVEMLARRLDAQEAQIRQLESELLALRAERRQRLEDGEAR